MTYRRKRKEGKYDMTMPKELSSENRLVSMHTSKIESEENPSETSPKAHKDLSVNHFKETGNVSLHTSKTLREANGHLESSPIDLSMKFQKLECGEENLKNLRGSD